MRISDAFPSKYLKAADLNGKEYELLIKAVLSEDISSGSENKAPQMKPVMYLESKTGQPLPKAMVLNKTNAQVIAAEHGDETDAWPGKPVVIYPTKVHFAGEMVDAIRVRIPAEKADPESDGIPF